jgi:hypothetical protein
MSSRKLFVHAYDGRKKLHIFLGVHENLPGNMTPAEIKTRYGIREGHTAYVKEPSGERIYVQRHEAWKGR